jgi:signal transduction histidine kinase/CheY-like chemotaxis protein
MYCVRLQGWSAFAFSIGGVLAATLLRLAIDPFLSDGSPFAISFATAILVFAVSSLGPALLELVLGGVIGSYLFLTSRGSLAMTAVGAGGLALYLFNGGAMLLLFHWLRAAREAAKRRQADEAIRDASATVKAAYDLSEAKETAEAANLAKDRFLAGLSHELRTPLTPVLLGISYLIDGGNAPADLLETFEMIRRNVEQEARLIDDLLDVVQIRRGILPGSPRLVDAHALIRQAFAACRCELDTAGVECWVELDAPLHHVEADPARFRQAIAQLLKNAAKFSHRGGRVAIRSRLEPIVGNGHPGRLVVEVADSGIGIEPEALTTIFDSFGQGRPADPRRRIGLGLGLSICRAIVAGAGGTLDAASPGRGRGATFTIRLDALHASEHPAQKVTAPAAAPMPRLRILIVEDDEMTRRVVSRVVRALGHEVTTADSVATAVADDAPPIDLLISDIGLPDGSGHDVLRRLRSRHPLKAIALSGFGLDVDIALSHSSGFAEHLTKPIDVRTLETAIRRVANSA